MNEDFSLGKMSADARLTATFKYYEKTEQDGEIIITACLEDGDVPRLNRGYGLDGNELWLSLNNLYQSIRGKDDNRPGSMKLWFSTKRPIFVVPERSKPMQARSDG